MKTSVKRRAKNCIRGAVLLACFIAVWYVASCFTQPLFIPAPATVWEAIVGLAETGQLQKGLAYSFLRITGASALSMLVAIPLSLLIYGVKPIKETIMPVVSFLRYVPVTAFSPLLILRSRSTKRKIVSRLVMARNLSSSCRASSSSHVTKLLQSVGIWAALIVQSKAGITVWAMLLKLTRWQS